MKRIKVGIVLITLFSLLFGTTGIASAKTNTHPVKASHVISQHVTYKAAGFNKKSQKVTTKRAAKKLVHKSVKHQAKKSVKLTSHRTATKNV